MCGRLCTEPLSSLHLSCSFLYVICTCRLVSYEKIDTRSQEGMRVIISSQALYFFEDSPPDPTSLSMLIKLDNLIDCRATKGKTSEFTVLNGVRCFLINFF